MKRSDIKVGVDYAIFEEPSQGVRCSMRKPLQATVLETRGERTTVYATAAGEVTDVKQGIVVCLAEPIERPSFALYEDLGTGVFRPAWGAKQVGTHLEQELVLESGACVLQPWEEWVAEQEAARLAKERQILQVREDAEALIAAAPARVALITATLEALQDQGCAVSLGRILSRTAHTVVDCVLPASGTSANHWEDDHLAQEIDVWLDPAAPRARANADISFALEWRWVTAAGQPGVAVALAKSEVNFDATSTRALRAFSKAVAVAKRGSVVKQRPSGTRVRQASAA